MQKKIALNYLNTISSIVMHNQNKYLEQIYIIPCQSKNIPKKKKNWSQHISYEETTLFDT